MNRYGFCFKGDEINCKVVQAIATALVGSGMNSA